MCRRCFPMPRTVFGIDIEAEHLSIAQRTLPGASLALAFCETLPLATAAYDLVLSHEVLEHVRR